MASAANGRERESAAGHLFGERDVFLAADEERHSLVEAGGLHFEDLSAVEAAPPAASQMNAIGDAVHAVAGRVGPPTPRSGPRADRSPSTGSLARPSQLVTAHREYQLVAHAVEPVRDEHDPEHEHDEQDERDGGPAAPTHEVPREPLSLGAR